MCELDNKSVIYIVTVNYKGEKVLENFLKSLDRLQHPESKIQIVIVDSSGELDGSLISSISKHKTEIIRLVSNQGFAYAANVGLRTSLQYSKLLKTRSYVWLLNPDTLVHPNALTELLENCNSHSILGSVVTNDGFTPGSTIWGAGGSINANLDVDMRYHAEPLSNVPKDPFDCDYIPGCSMFIPVKVLEKHGYLPEEFFLYFEETDWCLKLRKKGVTLKIIPTSLVQHISETGKMDAPYRVYFYNRNQTYFKFKNLIKRTEKIALLLKTIAKIPKLIFLVSKEKNVDLRNIFLAHLFANFDASRMLISNPTNMKTWKKISLSRLRLLNK